MTLATVWESVSGDGGPASSSPRTYFSEKNSEYYHYGSHKKSKGKSKSDKKHAVLSALTLLAFLFFLNILQNCIREQSQNRGTAMMFLPTAPTGQQSKEPEPGRPNENHSGKKRSSEAEEKREKSADSEPLGRKTRNLLGIPASEDLPPNTHRKLKFIRNFNNVDNWIGELSQVSDKDLEDQKLKTMNFPSRGRNGGLAPPKEFSATTSRATLTPGSSNAKIEKSASRKITKRERTAVASSENETANSSNDAAQKRIRDRGNSAGRNPGLQKNHLFENRNETSRPERRRGVPLNGFRKGFYRSPIVVRSDLRPLQETAASGTLPAPAALENERSHRSSSPAPPRYDEREYRGPYSSTPVLGLDLDTFRTFPVYDYRDRRNRVPLSGENETASAVFSEDAEAAGVLRAPVRAAKPAAEPYAFGPSETSHPDLGPPFFEFGNEPHDYRSRHPSTNRHSQVHGYEYSPHRKVAADEGLRFRHPFREDYRVVLAERPANEEHGFDLLEFFWTLFSSFAKPLTRIVPGFAKEDDRRPQCLDLFVCEARRVSRFVGPAAEALTATLGSLLTWAATGETRQSVAAALSAARDDTCQQQIRECEGRSGGKSAITLIAQLMEMKLR